MWASRFKKYSINQQQNNDNHGPDANLAFTIPSEYIIQKDVTSASLFHGGIDSPSINVLDPVLNQSVNITKHLILKSKTSTQQYIDHLYERILKTNNLSHPNVCRILSWYIADACLYSITRVIHRTLRHAIQSELFSLERIHRISLQIIHGTIYLQSKGLCPLTPWYTTNIELCDNDHIRLCSPTISTTKLNGGILPHHHLWRHAPESLIRMIISNENSFNDKFLDNSKEDVWSIGCIIAEMMINTILFQPQNEDPSLQLLCIVQYVGGLTVSLYEHFPSHVKKLFSKIKFDTHQQRLNRLLRQLLSQERFTFHNHHLYTKENTFDLLTEIFQFQSEKRISLESLIEHPFYSINSSLKTHKLRTINSPTVALPMNISSIQIDDLIHLCIKLNIKQSRSILTLKERCLLELMLHIKNFRLFNVSQCGLSQALQYDIKKLIYFLTNT